MIKTFAGGSEQVTTRARPRWIPSAAPCPWGWTTAGTKSSSTCQISPGEPTEPIIQRRCEFRFVDVNQASLSTDCLVLVCCPYQIHANCRIRRVYFSDRLYSEDELPAEFKLVLPIQKAKVSTLLYPHTGPVPGSIRTRVKSFFLSFTAVDPDDLQNFKSSASVLQTRKCLSICGVDLWDGLDEGLKTKQKFTCI